MVRGRPLLSGDSEMEQLLCIFRYGYEVVWTTCLNPLNLMKSRRKLTSITFVRERLFGTPTEQMRPGVKNLKDWYEYLEWKPMSLASEVPNLSCSGLDFLSVCSSLSLKPTIFVTYFKVLLTLSILRH